MRDSAVITRHVFEAIRDLESKSQLNLYEAIFELAFYGKDTEFTGLEHAFFTLIKPEIYKSFKYVDRHSKDYYFWRNSVLERDKYECQNCGNFDTILHAHHIKSFSKYPDLRFELANGLTLCKNCHIMEHKKNA